MYFSSVGSFPCEVNSPLDNCGSGDRLGQCPTGCVPSPWDPFKGLCSQNDFYNNIRGYLLFSLSIITAQVEFSRVYKYDEVISCGMCNYVRCV